MPWFEVKLTRTKRFTSARDDNNKDLAGGLHQGAAVPLERGRTWERERWSEPRSVESACWSRSRSWADFGR
jgi:hypothetical protein